MHLRIFTYDISDDMVIQSLMNAIIIKDFQSIQESQYVRIVHDKIQMYILTMNYKSN